MKRTILKPFLLYTILGFLLFVLFLILTFPKFIFLDRQLTKYQLYLTAKGVEEGPTSIRLKDVSIYDQTSRLLYFDKLDISLGLLKINVFGSCEGKSLQVELSPWSRSFKAQDFPCFTKMESITANLTFREGIYGTVLFKDLRLQDIRLQELSLDMKGRVFTAKAKAMGFELVGDGQIVYNPSEPLRSKINGRVSGGGMSFTISGPLENLQLSR